MGVLVITIDGPAAAGKTTLAGALSRSLGIGNLNTGALYRAATWVMRDRGLKGSGPAAVLDALKSADLGYEDVGGDARLSCGGRDITADLSDPQLTREIRLVADEPELRLWLNEWQRRLCRGAWKVTEGRDQGTDVFPEAPVKIFLTANQRVRIDRRLAELMEEGVDISRDELERDFIERDAADLERPMGALRRPEGSLLLECSEMDRDAVLATARDYIDEKIREGGLPGLSATPAEGQR